MQAQNMNGIADKRVLSHRKAHLTFVLLLFGFKIVFSLYIIHVTLFLKCYYLIILECHVCNVCLQNDTKHS